MKSMARRSRPWAPVLLVALSLSACELFRANPVTGQNELSFFSDADEVGLGAKAAPGMEQESGGLYKDPQLEAYVSSVGARLAQANDRKGIAYRYRVLDSGVINAFALPGGFVYITRGLLARLGNEDELAAVLGHETGHVAARHGVKHLQVSMGLNVLLSIASQAASRAAPESAAAARAGLQTAQLVAKLGDLKYSRDDERQADHLGITYAERAGWDPRGMLGLMKVLQSTEQGEPGAMDAILRTHPLTSERIKNAQEELAGRNPGDMDRLSRTSPEFDRQIGALRRVQEAYDHHDKAREFLGKAQSAPTPGARTPLLQQALAEANQAIKIDGRHAPFYATRSAVHHALAPDDRSGQVIEARDDALQAQRLDPSHFDAAFLLGLARLRLGENSGARAELTKAAGLNPGHPGPAYYLGVLAEKEGYGDEAVRRYTQASQMDAEGGSYGKNAMTALGRLRKGR